MNLLPDWAPNLHPLIVHFPIGLLFMAGLLDLVGTFARQNTFLRHASTLLYVSGAVAVLASWYTGGLAADSAFLPTEANALLGEHADLGQWTLWFFGGYAVLRLALGFGTLATRGIVRIILLILGLAGLGLLTVTADHGAEMVFRYGVGVQAVEDMPAPSTKILDDSETGLVVLPDSVWRLSAARPGAWKSDVSWLSGSPDDLRSSLVESADRGVVLALQAGATSPLFVVPDTLSNIQVDFSAHIGDLNGSLVIAHHVESGDDFRYAWIDASELRVGTREQGDFVVSAREERPVDGWHDYRLVVDGEHVRLYRDTELVLHAHGDTPNPGPVGLRLNGSGTVLLASLQVTSL